MTPKQQRFVDEYLKDLNATGAAERAGYSKKTAYSQGQRLLKNVEVKAAVEAEMAARSERVQFDQDRVLEELKHLAFSNVQNYVLTDDGHVDLAEGVNPEAMRAVSSIKRKTKKYTYADGSQSITHDVELKLWDKPNPLKLAGRHVGLFPNDVKVKVEEDTLAGLLKAAHEAIRSDERSSR